MMVETDAAISRSQRYRSAVRAIAGLVAAGLLGLPTAAGSAEVQARAVYSSTDIIPLEKLDPVPLACRLGPFQLEVPINRVVSVEVIGGRSLRLHFSQGETCLGKVPAEPLSGEWSHGDFKQDWRKLKRLDILKPALAKPEKVKRRDASLKGPKGIAVEGVKFRSDWPLEVRRGAFRFKIPWGRVRELKRKGPGGLLNVFLGDGGMFAGKLPKTFRGEWRGGILTIPGDKVAEITLHGLPKTSVPSAGSPRQTSSQGLWGTVADDSGTRVRLTGPPEFDGPFNLWDPVKQARDRTLLPLSRGIPAKGDVTVLVSAGAMTGFARKEASAGAKTKTLFRVTLASGKTYTGSVGKRKLLGKSPEGEFEIPLGRVVKLSPSARPATERLSSGLRAVLEFASGEKLTLNDPVLFYERRLLPDWSESG
ncbi:MAG: hypothetical protein ACE5JS_04260, partial [Nitrospinota bacterium]